MVCVCIAEDATGHGLYRHVVLNLDGNSQVCDAALVPLCPIVRDRIQVGVPPEPLRDLPQLHRLV